MKLLVNILEVDSLHILESFREVSFDRSIIDLQKKKKGLLFVTFCVLKNQYVRFSLLQAENKPKNQHLNQKMTQLVII